MTAAFQQSVAPVIERWWRVYDPNVHWIIFGVVNGAWLVAYTEGESRGWVKYPVRQLVIAIMGSFTFCFATRFAAGCQTHHFLGGQPRVDGIPVVSHHGISSRFCGV
ncbi:MAG: YeeE/YedE family protein [Gammaproteobacteria bacterium]|nr:YeeE/YedE family protein [Gammaproteobacteria bacterium]